MASTKLIERRLSLARSGLSQSLSFGPEAPVTELTQADLNAISKYALLAPLLRLHFLVCSSLS